MGKQWKQCQTLFFRLQNHCRWWLQPIKRHLLLGRKVMTNLDSILKTRDVTLPTKVCLVKAVVFPVVKYGCESWAIKKAEHRRLDAFELWCWRRLLRVSWTARRANQSILKEISPECLLEGLMLKLKLQSFGHLMRRTDSFEKTLMLWKIEGLRRRGHCLQCRSPRLNPWVGKIPWRRDWISTPVFLSGDFHEQRTLEGHSPWDCKELDTFTFLNYFHYLDSLNSDSRVPPFTWQGHSIILWRLEEGAW